MTKPNAIDESWGRVPPKVAKAAGIQVVYGYLSHDPSKNLTSAQLKAYHAEGIGVWFGWESTTGRPLLGASAGIADATDALAQLQTHAANVGYAPESPISVPFSLDQDVNRSQIAASLPYYTAAQRVLDGEGWWAGAYGSYALIEYLAAHGFEHGLFQTYAWSGGRLSAHAALYQYLNGQSMGGASVDYDLVKSTALLGAWWPPGHPNNTLTEDQMTPAQIKAISDAVYDEIMKKDALPAPADSASFKTNPTWSFQSHICGITQNTRSALQVLSTLASGLAHLQSMVSTLQGTVAALDQKVDAVRDGQVTVPKTTVPATLTIGG